MTARVQVAARVCECCEVKFQRRRFPSGQLERLSKFAKRRFCSDACYRKAAASGGKLRSVGAWIVRPYAQKATGGAVGDPVLSARATPAKHTPQNGSAPPGARPALSAAVPLPRIPKPRTEETP